MNTMLRCRKHVAGDQRVVSGGGSALRVFQPPSGARPRGLAGPALPVRVVTPGELTQNGGGVTLLANEPVVVELTTEGAETAGTGLLVFPVDTTGAYDPTF